jgi:hypothetical protein
MLYLNLDTSEMLEKREKVMAKHKALATERETIERNFNHPIFWVRLQNNKASINYLINLTKEEAELLGTKRATQKQSLTIYTDNGDYYLTDVISIYQQEKLKNILKDKKLYG